MSLFWFALACIYKWRAGHSTAILFQIRSRWSIQSSKNGYIFSIACSTSLQPTTELRKFSHKTVSSYPTSTYSPAFSQWCGLKRVWYRWTRFRHIRANVEASSSCSLVAVVGRVAQTLSILQWYKLFYMVLRLWWVDWPFEVCTLSLYLCRIRCVSAFHQNWMQRR